MSEDAIILFNLYLLPIQRQDKDDAGVDLLFFDGDLSDVLGGNVVVLNRRYYDPVPAAVVSVSYDAVDNETLVRLAAGTVGANTYRWVAVATPITSALAQQETDAINDPSLLSRFVSWIGL